MKIEKSVREDGLMTITVKVPQLKNINLCVAARGGYAFDPEDKEGLFHFWEHMAFKGTKSRNVQELQKLFDLYFFSPNAYTSELETVYGGEGYCGRIDNMCDVLLDAYINPTFPVEEIEREKNVVYNELAMNLDDENHQVYQALFNILYKINPRRRAGIGPPQGLQFINQDILFETHRKWYTASNTIVLAVGNIEHQQLKGIAFKRFPMSKTKVEEAKQSWDDEYATPFYEPERTVILPREQSITVFGCKIPYLGERDKAALNLLLRILGGGFSSILFQEVREKRGLCYQVNAGTDMSKRLGSYLAFYVQTQHKDAQEAKQLVYDIICGYPLIQDLFDIYKQVTLDRKATGFSSAASYENYVLKKIIDEDADPLEIPKIWRRSIKYLEQVTFEEVVKLREKLIVPEHLACAMVRPK